MIIQPIADFISELHCKKKKTLYLNVVYFFYLMFLLLNIVVILLVFRVLFDDRIVKMIMNYRWGFLLNFQHVLFFIVFILITVFTENYFLDIPALVYCVISVTIFNIGLYSLVYRYLVPQFYLANKYPEFILYAVICFLVSSLFRILLEPAVFRMNFTETLSNTKFLYNVYTAQGIVILFASFLGITKDKFMIEKDFEHLGQEKDQLHHDLLKSKLNPHFLLNTLNNIYSKSFHASENISESVLQLSKLLQYIIYDTGREKITVAQEFSSIRALAGLYQLKYSDRLNITFEFQNEETFDVMDIPPSVFLTPFENALKHSAIGIEEGSFIKVKYRMELQEIIFETVNSIAKKKIAVGNGENGGLGNEALMSILEKNHPGNFTFTSEIRDGNEYHTILKIKIQ